MGVHLSNNPGITEGTKVKFQTELGVPPKPKEKHLRSVQFVEKSHLEKDGLEIFSTENREQVQVRRILRDKQTLTNTDDKVDTVG